MMQSYVICIESNKHSVEAAERCIESGKKFGYTIKKHPAMCGFLSHRSLWMKAFKENKQILILEHDAIFIDKIPLNVGFDGVISFGKPSYGQYREAKKPGVYKMFSKVGGYMPGAHAYVVSPRGARKLLHHASEKPGPTDLFLNKHDFPFICEYYPWPIMADDKVSTIQHDIGCIAKHNYKKGIDIV